MDFMADLEKCKLENVKFFIMLVTFFYINQISDSLVMDSSSDSLVMDSSRLVYDQVQYQAPKFNNRDRRAILRF